MMRILLVLLLLVLLAAPTAAQRDPLERAFRILLFVNGAPIDPLAVTYDLQAVTFADFNLGCPRDATLYEPGYAGTPQAGWMALLTYQDVTYDIRLGEGYGFWCTQMALPNPPDTVITEHAT